MIRSSAATEDFQGRGEFRDLFVLDPEQYTQGACLGPLPHSPSSDSIRPRVKEQIWQKKEDPCFGRRRVQGALVVVIKNDSHCWAVRWNAPNKEEKTPSEKAMPNPGALVSVHATSHCATMSVHRQSRVYDSIHWNLVTSIPRPVQANALAKSLGIPSEKKCVICHHV